MILRRFFQYIKAIYLINLSFKNKQILLQAMWTFIGLLTTPFRKSIPAEEKCKIDFVWSIFLYNLETFYVGWRKEF